MISRKIIIGLVITALSFPAMALLSQQEKDKRLKQLTPMQFMVTQKSGTEPPFDNAYWDNKKEGIYVDIVSGEPLFSSADKFKSGTGWPSFTKPIAKDALIYKKDSGWFFQSRTEVLSKEGQSHLGHVFDDGPKPSGKRYCINSAALEFIPKDKMKQRGYEKFLYLFQPSANQKPTQ